MESEDQQPHKQLSAAVWFEHHLEKQQIMVNGVMVRAWANGVSKVRGGVERPNMVRFELFSACQTHNPYNQS